MRPNASLLSVLLFAVCVTFSLFFTDLHLALWHSHVPDAWLLLAFFVATPAGLLLCGTVWLAVSVWLVTRPGSWRSRGMRAALLIAGAGIAWEAPTIGPYQTVWRMQGEYLRRIGEAIAEGREAREASLHLDVVIDFGEDPPQLAAVTWTAAHGDWDGVVWDPSGSIARGIAPRWQFTPNGEVAVRHLWGPWYVGWSTG